MSHFAQNSAWRDWMGPSAQAVDGTGSAKS